MKYKIYIAGKITGLVGFKERFKEAENKLRSEGHKVMNPAILPSGFEQHEYMRICYAMIDTCEVVYFLDNWKDSVGAKREHDYAKLHNKTIIYQ